MTLFSGWFFPITEIPLAIRWLAWLSPLWRGNELARGAALGDLQWWPAVGHLTYLTVLLVGGPLVARRQLALGQGLGALVGTVDAGAGPVSYAAFIAPVCWPPRR